VLSQAGEADQVREADGDRLRLRNRTRLDVLRRDCGVANLLAQVQAEQLVDRGGKEGPQLAGSFRVAEADVALGVPRPQECAAEHAGDRGGDVRRAAAHGAAQLELLVVRDARLPCLLNPARPLQVLLGERPLAGLGSGHAGRAQRGLEEVAIEARLLDDVVQRVPRALALERALDRQQHQPCLLGRALELVQRDAVFRQALQQIQPRFAGLALGTVEQPLCLEVDRHARKTSIRPASGPAPTFEA
jgi:hypothetical protein